MITSVRLRTIAIIFAVILVGAGFLTGTAIYASSSKLTNGKTIVLDAGHGGRDGGVTGKNTGIKESDINLAVVKALKEYLEEKGYNVVLTRKNTDGLYSIFSKNKKMADLEKRKEIINNAKPDLMVSIHQNYYTAESVKGAQVFYSPNSELGKKAADTIQSVMNKSYGGNKKSHTGDYYILECSSYPSVLVECGFLSNPDDERMLVDATNQQKIAYNIFTAIHSLLDDGDLPVYF